MDQLKKIAKEFYEAFEGLQLYPKLFSWQWFLWFLTAIGAALCCFQFKTRLEGIPEYLWMPTVVFALVAIASIADYKAKALAAKYASYPCIDAARTSKLKELLGKEPSEFSEAAQDLVQLMELSQKCGKQPLPMRDLFPVPWEKGQFVMHVLTLAALIATISGLLFPDTAKQLGQKIDSRMIGQLIGYMFLLIFVSLTIYPFSRVLWHNTRLELRMWQARWKDKGPVSTAVHLDYLLSNLVRLHEPRPASIKRSIRRLTPSSVRRRKLR